MAIDGRQETLRARATLSSEGSDFMRRLTGRLELARLHECLERALARLSPEQRAVVELTYFGGCSYQEIAAITACPVNTVKTRMFHARAKLRELLPVFSESEPPP